MTKTSVKNGLRLGLFAVSMALSGLASGPVEATSVIFRFEAQPASKMVPISGSVQVRAVAGSSQLHGAAPDRLKTTRYQVDDLSKLELDLASGITWEISTEAKGFWAAPVFVLPTSQSSAAAPPTKIALWPTTPVEGRIRVPPSEALPGEVTLRFSPPRTWGHSTEDRPLGKTSCTVEPKSGSFRCSLPSGRSDLRLRAEGFVSHFRWNKNIGSENTHNLGLFPLTPGASLVGRIEAVDGELDPKTCRVELSPSTAGPPSPKTFGQREAALLTTSVDPQGFFQFSGLAAGSYLLSAKQPGMAETRQEGIHIFERAETELQEPLSLAPPLSLEARVEPPVDLTDQPWRFVLFRRGEIHGTIEKVADGVLARDGLLHQGDLSPATYLLRILDRAGSVVSLKTIHLDADAGEILVELPLVWITGTVRLGRELIPAELLFGGRSGPESVQVFADEDGEFFGYLPRDGAWNILVQNDELGLDRELLNLDVKNRKGFGSARLDLKVPDTLLRGRVVDEGGIGAAGAAVTVSSVDTFEFLTSGTDFDGFFTVRGVSPGTVSVSAESGTKASRVVRIAVAEDSAAPGIQLVLESLQTLEGRILGPAGGVPAALIEAAAHAADGTALVPGVSTTTRLSGDFELEVPADAVSVRLIIYPPGFGLTTLRVPLSHERERPFLQIQAVPTTGSLEIELSEPIRWEDPLQPKPMLFGDEDYLGAYSLGRWAEINGTRNLDPDLLAVPALLPGDYKLCLQSLDAATLAGRPVPKGRCASVTIYPYQATRISLHSDS